MTVFLRHIKICRHGVDWLSVPVNPTYGVSEQPLVSLIDGLVFISVLVGSGVAPRRRSAPVAGVSSSSAGTDDASGPSRGSTRHDSMASRDTAWFVQGNPFEKRATWSAADAHPACDAVLPTPPARMGSHSLSEEDQAP